MSDSVAEYTERRGEILAELVLTRDKDVHVLRFAHAEEMGVDLMARILRPAGGEYITSSLGVQVIATNEPLENEQVASKYAKSGWKRRLAKGSLLFPVLVMLFSMEGDVGYCGWLLEPDVSAKARPTLAPVETPVMKKVTKKSMDEIIGRVEKWWVAVREVLMTSRNEGT